MVLPPEISNAARARDIDAVRQFVEANPERINESFFHVGDGEGLNLLTLAIAPFGTHKSIEMVRYLISRGADVERRNANITPLFCACFLPDAEAMALLLQAGANVHRIDYEASIHCSFPLKRDMIVHLCEKRTQTIAQVTDGIFECLRLLLRAGLALDVLQDGTTTPLEQVIVECMLSLDDAGHLGRSLGLVLAMRASIYTSASPRLSPWRQYVLAPSVAVLRLRSLVVRGRARERWVVSGPTPRPIAWLLAPRTPREIVWNVLAFWNPRHE